MRNYIQKIVLVAILANLLSAKEASEVYLDFNASFSASFTVKDRLLRRVTLPVTLPTKSTNNNRVHNYLASLRNARLPVLSESITLDFGHSSQINKIFSKSSISGTNPRKEDKQPFVLSATHSIPNHNLPPAELWDLFNDSEYRERLLVGTKIWGGLSLAMMGLLSVMPQSVTRWQDDYLQDAMSNIDRAYSGPPVWDEDHWEINYIGHPYAGSLYYNTIRTQEGSILESFVFSTLISSSWEYIFEATAEQPSIQDLIITPVLGSLVGELTHQATLQMKKNGSSFFEKVFITIFNPMHALIDGY